MKKGLMLLLALSLLFTSACAKDGAKPQIEEKPAETPVSEPTAEPENEPTAAPEETPAPEPEPVGEPETGCFDALIGDWEIVSVEIGGETFDPAAIGMESSVSFFRNGAGVMKAQTGVGGKEQIFTFSVDGNRIGLFDEDNVRQEAVYDPETDTIRMESDMIVTIVLTRKAEEPEPEPEPEPAEEDFTTAELERFEDPENGQMIAITVTVPAHARVRIAFPHQSDYEYENEGDSTVKRKVKIPIVIFYPNEPASATEYVFTPQITITTADGTEHPVDCPTVTATLPMLTIEGMSLDDLMSDGMYHVKANADGVYAFEGKVDDESVLVYVNDVLVQTYYGGVFTADLTVENGEPTLWEIRAEKTNWARDVLLIVVEP